MYCQQPTFSFLESTTINGSRKHLHVQMSSDEINHLRGTIDQLREELHEERSRVDALKGTSINHVDIFLGIFDPPPLPSWSLLLNEIYTCGKKGLTVHRAIEVKLP